MKLTKRGNDLIAAIVVGTVAASFLDIKIILALCLTLVFTAMLSGVILLRATLQGAQIECNEPHISCFKGQDADVYLRLKAQSSRFTTMKISKVMPSRRFDSKVVSSEELGVSVVVTPKFAGRSSGLALKIEVGDPLGFFRRETTAELQGFVLDCLPSSILKEIQPLRAVYTSMGGREGRTQGLGLEFYSVDEYKGLREAKDIFWKKVAALPDEKLLVKVHARSMPTKISISLLRTAFRGDESVEWNDSFCEGVATIGKSILQLGSDVELLFDSSGKVSEILAPDLNELSKGIMEMSVAQTSDLESAAILIDEGDICVTGFRELLDISVASAVARKPALLIPDLWSSPSRIGDAAVIYDEGEDYRELVRRVVNK